MAMANDGKTMQANRWGLNLKFYKYENNSEWQYSKDDPTPVDELYTVDFANEVEHSIESGVTYATGGQAHSNMIGFKDSTTGTLTITTQIVTDTLRAIAAGMDISNYTEGDVVNYMNDEIAIIPQSYVITGETVYQDTIGMAHYRKFIYYKATVSPAADESFTGDGDPQELSIEFELGTNDAFLVESTINDWKEYEGGGLTVTVTGDGFDGSTLTLTAGDSTALSASIADATGATVDAAASWFISGTAGIITCAGGAIGAVAAGTTAVTVAFTDADGNALCSKVIKVVVTE